MIDLETMLGSDKKTEKNIMRIKVAHEKIMKRLEDKDQMDFNNFIQNEKNNIPPDVVRHFREAMRAYADCDKFKIPSMRRQAESRVIQTIQLDLKRVADWWVPSSNFKLFTLLHETETLIANYLHLESKFPDKYMKEIGKERGVSKEFVREKSKELSDVEVTLGMDHERIFSRDLIKKFTEPMNYLSSGAISILKFNETFIDYEKLSKEVDKDLTFHRKNMVFKNIDLPEWLKRELFFNSELRVREMAMQKMLQDSIEVFGKKITSSLKGTLTRLDKLVEIHKKLILTGETD